MAEGNGQGTGGDAGDQGAGGGQGAQDLGWRAGLPDNLKENEAFKSHKTVGDFAKVHLETVEKSQALEGKLERAIFKPGEKATTEETAAFRKALDVPEKAEGYEFPETEGVKNDPKMISWAQGVFHKASIPKGAAEYIGGEWNKFLLGLHVEEEKQAKKEREKAEEVLKGELKTDELYKEGVALVTRLLKETATPEELTWLQESKMGNHPALIRLVLKMAKKTGEDLSPQGGKGGGGDEKEGFEYDKSPTPPTN